MKRKERKLRRNARLRGYTDERADQYVQGTIRKENHRKRERKRSRRK